MVGILQFTSVNYAYCQGNVHELFAARLFMLDVAYQKVSKSEVEVFNEEIKLQQSEYLKQALEIKKVGDSSAYAYFAARRLITLSYLYADSLKTLLMYHDSLISISSNYFKYIETNRDLANDIAECIVNGFEICGIRNKDSLLYYVDQTIKKHIETVYNNNASIVQKRDVVDRYAAQYYNRGMISMGVSVFKNFKQFYNTPNPETKPIVFTKNYSVYNKLNQKATDYNSVTSGKVLMFNQVQSNFDAVFLISILRLAEKYPLTQFIIARDSNHLSDMILDGIGNNIAGNLLFMNLSTDDAEYYKKSANFIIVDSSNNVLFATDNAIEIVDRLEQPFDSINEIKKQKRIKQNVLFTQKNTEFKNIPTDLSKKQIYNTEKLNLTLCGDWYAKTNVQFVKHYLTTNDTVKIKPSFGFTQLKITDEKSGNITIPLIAQQYKQEVELYNNSNSWAYGDSINIIYNEDQFKLEKLVQLESVYGMIIKDYPNIGNGFISKIQLAHDSCRTNIHNLVSNNDNKQITALLQASYSISQMLVSSPPDTVNYNELAHIFPESNFDTVLYYSHFYKNFIDVWLLYTQNSTAQGIDLLFGSGNWMPDKAVGIVGRYLWKEMNKRALHKVMLHIDTSYLAGCFGTRGDVSKRLEGYKRMTKGNKAPNILWNENDTIHELYKMDADTVFVVFWADWCAHCKSILPEIHKKLLGKPSVEVIAINLDSDESSSELGKLIMPKWHHLQASEKWNNKYVELYNVFGTPEIFLLNSNFEILENDNVYNKLLGHIN